MVTDAFERYLEQKRIRRSSGDPATDIRRGWDAHVAFARGNPAVYQLMFPAGAPPSAAASDSIALLRDAFERIARAGLLRDGVTPEHATRTLSAALHGVTAAICAEPAERGNARLSATVRRRGHIRAAQPPTRRRPLMSTTTPATAEHSPGAGLLAGMVIVISGASTGIGADAARLFAREGARLVLGARSEQRLAELCDELTGAGAETTYDAADISRAEDVQRLIDTALEHYGRLDGAFNNAGISQGGGLLADITEETFDQVLAVNLKGVWLAMRAEIHAMLRHGAGAIVNTSSVGGIRGGRDLSAYLAAKHGVIGLTRGAAHDYGPQGLRINAIAPGTTLTPMMIDWRRRDPTVEARLDAATPLRRGGQPTEIAQAAAWLLSDRASYINGAVLAVDGGMTA